MTHLQCSRSSQEHSIHLPLRPAAAVPPTHSAVHLTHSFSTVTVSKALPHVLPPSDFLMVRFFHLSSTWLGCCCCYCFCYCCCCFFRVSFFLCVFVCLRDFEASCVFFMFCSEHVCSFLFLFLILFFCYILFDLDIFLCVCVCVFTWSSLVHRFLLVCFFF